MRYLPLFLFIHLNLAFRAEEMDDLLSADDLKELQAIVVSTVSSCSDKIFSDQSALVFAKKELQEIAKGVEQVVAEAALTLALKKDYPNACHVLASPILANVEASKNSKTRCLVEKPWGGGCLVSQEQEHPVFSYHWPKYFIEVSEKGNDPHPAFANDNKLYAASRKLANHLSDSIGLDGSKKLVAKVTAAASMIKGATSAILGQGFDFSSTPEDMARAGKAIALAPFEKLRIRANKEADMPAFEANIWPVGLSQTIAEHLSICGKGGFSWSIPGVPMTCPVAMSRDAWTYWDTGAIDYLNPSTLRGITAASNPVACIADNIASVHFDQYGEKASTATQEEDKEKNKKQKLLADLPNNLRGIGMCSFPILGDAEAIANQTANLANSFKGPWCSLWGPLVPRMSTQVYASDYGFPNAALKFKTLAHDLFGTPRGQRERWALAYPWEATPSSSFIDSLKELFKSLAALGIENINPETKEAKGRSVTLMPPGDPRLIDIFSTADLVNDAKNLAREVAYLAALNKAATEAEKATLKAFREEHNTEGLTAEKIVSEHRRELEIATDETARLKGEPIYRKKIYCHIKGEKHGLVTRGEVNLSVAGFGTELFQSVPSVEHCHQISGRGKCISRHKVTGKCLRPETVDWVSIEKWEIERYQKVPHPRQYGVDRETCTYRAWKTPNTHKKHHRCKEHLVELGKADTREQLAYPDPENPSKTIGEATEGGKLAGQAAKVATWVGAEIARAKYEEMSGKSYLPGKKRVYTVFEEIKCEPRTIEGGEVYRKKVPGGWVWNSCKDAVRVQIRVYFQKKLLRKVCDRALNYKLGQPFK